MPKYTRRSQLCLHDASPVVRYGIAAGISVLGLVLQYSLMSMLGNLPFALLYPVVFAVMAIVGFGPGVFANVISSLGTFFIFIEPHFEFTAQSEIADAKLFIFFISCLILSVVMERNQRGQRELERELRDRRESEFVRERLNSLVMDAPVVICFSRGPNHEIELLNRMGFETLAEREWAGRPLCEIMPELQKQGIIERMDEVMRNREPYSESEVPCEITNRHGGRVMRYLNVHFKPWFEANGEVAGVFSFIIDVTSQVTARRKVEAAEERLTLAMEASGQASWEIDLKTHSVNSSPALWRMFGFDPEDGSRRDHFDLVKRLHASDRARHREILQGAIDSRSDYRNEYKVIWPDGSEHWIASRGRILRDMAGRPTRMVGISVDKTETKNFEQELQRAKDEAERANRLKSVFLANMSHEIRTPLAALLGFTDLLRNPDLTGEDRARYLEIMSRNGHQLHSVINDILDLSKVEAGQMQLETAEIKPLKLAQEVITLLEVSLAERNLKFELRSDDSAPASLTSDAVRIKQILLNIVGNAAKFTAQGFVRVSLSGRMAADGSTLAVFEVRDSGMGIPAAQHEHIFESFTQADSSMSRRFGGTGLGLPLSRRLARLLGGDLRWIESREGEGTVFEISVATNLNGASVHPAPQPIARPTPPPTPAAPEVVPAASDYRVLIVEDSSDNRELLRLYLANESVQLDFAEDGQDGMLKAQRSFYDLILMDIQMPVMDGYEATRRLRDSGYHRPIVALTAHALSEFRLRGFNAGFTDYLTKPIHRQELLKTLKRFSPARSGDLVDLA